MMIVVRVGYTTRQISIRLETGKEMTYTVGNVPACRRKLY